MIILLALLLAFTPGLHATDVFVSPTGSDASGQGSISNPYKTLSFALESLATTIPRPWTTDVTVYLRGGTYPLTQPVTLLPGQGGRDGYTLSIAAYPQDSEPVVVSGGVELPTSAWTPVPGGRGVWSAPCPPGLTNVRQSFVGNSRVNETFLGNATSVYGYQLLSKADSNVTSWGYLTKHPGLVAASKHPLQVASDAEFLFRMVGSQWVEERVRVASWELLGDGVTLNITLAQPAFYMLRNKMYVGDFPSHVINLFAALEGSVGTPGADDGVAIPGTGYLSCSGAGGSSPAMYYNPGAALASTPPVGAVIAAVEGPLIAIAGNRSTSAWVENVSLTGFTLAYSSWTQPSGPCGYIPDQGGFFYTCEDAAHLPGMGHAVTGVVPGTLSVSGGRGFRAYNLTVCHTGGTAVTVDGGSQVVTLKQLLVWDAGGSGVRFGQVDDFSGEPWGPSGYNAHSIFNDSVVVGGGAEWRDCPLVMGGYYRNLTLSYLTLHNSSWAGITVGWGWGTHHDPLPTHGGNVIEHCHIHTVNQLTADGGPIYVMGPQQWSEMRFNHVERALHHAAMLYHDEGSAYWWTHDNVVNETKRDQVPCGGWWYSWLAAWASSEHDILMGPELYTTSDLTRVDQYCQNCPNNLTVMNFTVVPAGGPWPPKAQAIVDGAGATWV